MTLGDAAEPPGHYKDESRVVLSGPGPAGSGSHVTRREVLGAALLALAAVAGLSGSWLAEEAQKALGQDVFLFVSVPVAAIGGWLVVLALLAAVAGVILLVPAVIRRIRRRKLRLAMSWIIGLAAAAAAPYLTLLLFFASLVAAMSSDVVRFDAAGGQSVLVTQDQLDGDTVNIYTREDDMRYRWIRSGPEISGWPRVKDQNCVLDTSAAELQLTCGSKTLAIKAQQ